MRNLTCNDRWTEGWDAIRSMWRKQEVAARAQRAVRPCASGQSASSAPPTVLTPAEPPSSSEPSPPPLTPTKPSPHHSVPAPSEPRPVRPAPTHPWRRPFSPPSFRLAERSGFCKNLTRTPLYFSSCNGLGFSAILLRENMQKQAC